MRLKKLALLARDLDRVAPDLTDVLVPGVPFADPGVAFFALRNTALPIAAR